MRSWESCIDNALREVSNGVITTVAGQQLRDAFPWDAAPPYLLRDRDRIFGDDFTKQVQGMGIKEMISAPQAPWVSNIKLSGFPVAQGVLL